MSAGRKCAKALIAVSSQGVSVCKARGEKNKNAAKSVKMIATMKKERLAFATSSFMSGNLRGHAYAADNCQACDAPSIDFPLFDLPPPSGNDRIMRKMVRR